MQQSVFAKGECRCGAISYIITGKPKTMAQCHCTDCQKATGTGHMSLGFFSRGDVVISGEAKGYMVTTDNGNQSTRFFCPTCGSRLYGLNSGRPDSITIAVGSLDNHSWFSPNAVVYTKHRNDWDITRTDIPNFDEMPPPPSGK